MTTHRPSRADGKRTALRWGVAVAGVLVAFAAAAQSPQPLAPAPAQPPPSTTQAPAPASSPWPSAVPGYQPGFFDAVGRWMQQSTAGFNSNVSSAWNSGKGVTDAASDAASSAARSTADAAKGAAEAGQGVANAMGSVARDTAGALTRLPGARIVVGRERCGVAPNGAPDCGLAALALCRSQGLAGGNSVDIETTEKCPPDASVRRWRGETVACTTDNFVTRSLCQ
jgi:hypothetical protein